MWREVHFYPLPPLKKKNKKKGRRETRMVWELSDGLAPIPLLLVHRKLGREIKESALQDCRVVAWGDWEQMWQAPGGAGWQPAVPVRARAIPGNAKSSEQGGPCQLPLPREAAPGGWSGARVSVSLKVTSRFEWEEQDQLSKAWRRLKSILVSEWLEPRGCTGEKRGKR